MANKERLSHINKHVIGLWASDNIQSSSFHQTEPKNVYAICAWLVVNEEDFRHCFKQQRSCKDPIFVSMEIAKLNKVLLLPQITLLQLWTLQVAHSSRTIVISLKTESRYVIDLLTSYKAIAIYTADLMLIAEWEWLSHVLSRGACKVAYKELWDFSSIM